MGVMMKGLSKCLVVTDNGFVGVVVMALIDDRSVHGFATKDHSMWKFHCSFCHGRQIPYRPSCHGSCFHCCWP